MDIPAILIKLTGIVLLVWTGRSIYLHIKDKKDKEKQNKEKEQSISEQILNNILLYLWFAFMLAFSIGMILNN